jgi:predicted GTPase
MQESRSALLAYYYFDFKDASKRDIRGLLASILLQLVDDSDCCWDLLFQLHKKCRDGQDQPSETALAQCLKSMLDLPGQPPTYIIIDALDECSNTTGTPSPREKVLNFVEDLVRSTHSNLFICITSRPEQDISTTLNPLTSQSRRVSLHEEGGQREDINSYIRSFVLNDKAMRRWRAEEKELVISVLSERAQGM